MWIRLEVRGGYLPIQSMLIKRSVEYIHLTDSVLAILDTPSNRRIATFIALSYPCAVQESIALADILLEFQTYSPKRIVKMS